MAGGRPRAIRTQATRSGPAPEPAREDVRKSSSCLRSGALTPEHEAPQRQAPAASAAVEQPFGEEAKRPEEGEDGPQVARPVGHRGESGNAAGYVGWRIPPPVPELGQGQGVDVLAVPGDHADHAWSAREEVERAFPNREGKRGAVF